MSKSKVSNFIRVSVVPVEFIPILAAATIRLSPATYKPDGSESILTDVTVPPLTFTERVAPVPVAEVVVVAKPPIIPCGVPVVGSKSTVTPVVAVKLAAVALPELVKAFI